MNFGDYLKSATEAFGSVYSKVKPAKPDPNTAARAATTDQNQLLTYLAIGGAALLGLVLVISLARK